MTLADSLSTNTMILTCLVEPTNAQIHNQYVVCNQLLNVHILDDRMRLVSNFVEK